MATRTRKWLPAKEQSLLNGTSPNSGSGNDAHIPVRADGQSFRGLIRFTSDWSGVERLTAARLYLRTSGGSHISSSNWRNGSLRIGRLSSSFASGGGGENYWATNAATVWGGPNVGNSVDRQWPTAASSWADRDVYDVVRRWLPESRLDAAGNPGPGDDNYGVRLAAMDGLVIEYQGMRSSNKPYIVITYDDTVAPTIDWVYPSEDAARLVLVTGTDPGEEPSARLRAVLTAGNGDRILSASFRVVEGTDPDANIVDAGPCEPAPGSPVSSDGSFTWERNVPVPLDLGGHHAVFVDIVTGNQGTVRLARGFAMPAGVATWAVFVGQDPENVGASVVTVPPTIPTQAPRDGIAMSYARSADGSTPVTPWTASVPAFPPGAWFLLVRAVVWRRTPGYVPAPPEGVDRIVVSWRGV